MRVHIQHTLKNFPGAKADYGIHHVAIHIPPRDVASVMAATADASFPGRSIGRPPPQSLIFDHPDLINKDSDVTDTIYAHMTQNQEISTLINALALQMRQMGAPTESWIRPGLVPFTPPLDPDNPGEGAATAFDGKKTCLRVEPARPNSDCGRTGHDGDDEGNKWPVAAGGRSGNCRLAPAELPQLSPSRANDGHRAWRRGCRRSVERGGRFIQIMSAACRPASSCSMQPIGKCGLISVTRTSRYLAAYVRFLMPTGMRFSVPNWKPDGAGIVDDIVSALTSSMTTFASSAISRQRTTCWPSRYRRTASSAPH